MQQDDMRTVGMLKRVVWRTPKRRSISTKPHDITFRKTAIFIVVVRTWNLTYNLPKGEKNWIFLSSLQSENWNRSIWEINWICTKDCWLLERCAV